MALFASTLGVNMFKRIKEYFRKPKVGDIWYIDSKLLYGDNPFRQGPTFRYIITDVYKNWVRLREVNSSILTEYPISEFKSVFKREV